MSKNKNETKAHALSSNIQEHSIWFFILFNIVYKMLVLKWSASVICSLCIYLDIPYGCQLLAPINCQNTNKNCKQIHDLWRKTPIERILFIPNPPGQVSLHLQLYLHVFIWQLLYPPRGAADIMEAFLTRVSDCPNGHLRKLMAYGGSYSWVILHMHPQPFRALFGVTVLTPVT